MNCARQQSRIVAWVEGELDEAARNEIAQHTPECRDCADLAEFHSQLRRELTGAPSILPPPVYFEGMLAEIHRRMPAAPLSAPRFTRRLQRQQMATAVMGGLFGMIMLTFLSGGGEQSAAVQGNSSRVASSAITKPTLIAQVSSEIVEGKAGLLSRSGMVMIQDLGWVSAKSDILKMTPQQRREVGIGEPVRAVRGWVLASLPRDESEGGIG